MKWLLALLEIGALGYVGYTYKDEILAKTAQWRAGEIGKVWASADRKRPIHGRAAQAVRSPEPGADGVP